MAYCAETDSDPISETTLAVLSVPDTALDADSASAHIVANDSLQVLLQQGKRQSEVMEAAAFLRQGHLYRAVQISQGEVCRLRRTLMTSTIHK